MTTVQQTKPREHPLRTFVAGILLGAILVSVGGARAASADLGDVVQELRRMREVMGKCR